MSRSRIATGKTTGTNKRLSRRQFVASSVASAAALTWTAPAIVRGRNLNEKLNIAVIGSGGRGGSNLRAVGLGKHRRPVRRQ